MKRSLQLIFITALGGALVLLSGCSGKATITVTVTLAKPVGLAVANGAGGSMNVGAQILPEGMTGGFDVSNFEMDLVTTNVNVTTTSGAFTVNLLKNGSVIASNTYNFYVVNGNLHPSNPGAINVWLSHYVGVADEVDVSAPIQTVPSTTAQATASLVNNVVYAGTVRAAASRNWDINTFHCPPNMRNCQQP